MTKEARRTNTGKSGSGKVKGVKNLKPQTIRSKNQIKSKEAYDLTMQEIDTLMKRGEANLSLKDKARLRDLAEAAEIYEDMHDPLPLPSTLPGMIKMKLVVMHISQSYAAKLLGVSDAKFSMIMNGKQKPDVYFIKAVHEKLQIDANLILQTI